MIYFQIFIFLIFVYNLRFKTDGAKPFDKRSTTCIKGVCAIYVVFHHLGQNIGLSGFAGQLNGYLGGIAVGVFFMLSAFGLVRSYLSNGTKFLKKMLFKNLPKLYLIYIVINTIYYFIFSFNKISVIEAVLRILGFDFIYNFNRMNGYSWFITTVIIVYIIFLLCYFICDKFKNKNIAPIVLSSCILLIYLLVRYAPVSIPSLYVRAILCFVIGVLYATYFEFINKILNKFFIIFLLLFIGLTGIGIAIGDEHFISLMICCFIITFSQKFTYANNITYFLGVISLEIYLLQLIPINLLNSLKLNELLFIFSVLSSTITFAFIFKTFEKLVTMFIFNSREYFERSIYK